jgi:hypothetical protein
MVDFEPPVAFTITHRDPPGAEIRINFGILAGREATPAEIDELGRTLLQLVSGVSIVSEQHYEMGRGHEAVVHLVSVALDDDELLDDSVEERVVAAAEQWARACADARRAGV